MRWVVGDVHGEYHALNTLVELVRKQDSNPVFCFVGDYVDRGPNSKDVVEFIINLPNAYPCRGNHDDIFDLIINENGSVSRKAPDPSEIAEQAVWFYNFGMDLTLKSYGVTDESLSLLAHKVRCGYDPEPDILAIREIIPVHHREFFRTLPLMREYDEFFTAHAFLPPDIEINDKNAENMLWGRFSLAEINKPKVWTKKGYFGHTPTKVYNCPNDPISGPLVTLVDTGAAFGHRLTAWCHDEGRYLQVNRLGEII